MLLGDVCLIVLNGNGLCCYISTSRTAEQSKAANYPIKDAEVSFKARVSVVGLTYHRQRAAYKMLARWIQLYSE